MSRQPSSSFVFAETEAAADLGDRFPGQMSGGQQQRVVWLHSGTIARQERVAAPAQAPDLDW